MSVCLSYVRIRPHERKSLRADFLMTFDRSGSKSISAQKGNVWVTSDCRKDEKSVTAQKGNVWTICGLAASHDASQSESSVAGGARSRKASDYNVNITGIWRERPRFRASALS